jgi:hypothetical protein
VGGGVLCPCPCVRDVCVCRRCAWMYGELTEKEAVERVDRALDHHLADQFEILLYKKNRACFALLLIAALFVDYLDNAQLLRIF